MAFFMKALSTIMQSRAPKTLDDLMRCTDANADKLRTVTSGTEEEEKLRAQMYKDLIGVARNNIPDRVKTLQIIAYWCDQRNAEDVEFMTAALCELVHDGTTTPDHILSVFDDYEPSEIPKTIRTLMSKIRDMRVTVSDDDEDEKPAKTFKKKHAELKRKKEEARLPTTSDDEIYEDSRRKKPRTVDPELAAIEKIKDDFARASAMTMYALKTRVQREKRAEFEKTKALTPSMKKKKLVNNERFEMLESDDEDVPALPAKHTALVVREKSGGGGGKPRHDPYSGWESDWVSGDDEDRSKAIERVPPHGWGSSDVAIPDGVREKIIDLINETTKEQRADIKGLKIQQAKDRKLLEETAKKANEIPDINAKLDRILDKLGGGGGASPDVPRISLPPPPPPRTAPPTVPVTTSGSKGSTHGGTAKTRDPLELTLEDFVFSKSFTSDYGSGKYDLCWEYLQRARTINEKYRNTLAAQEKAKPKGEVAQHWDKIKELARPMIAEKAASVAPVTGTSAAASAAAAPAGSAGKAPRSGGDAAGSAGKAPGSGGDTSKTSVSAPPAPPKTTGAAGGGLAGLSIAADDDGDDDNKFDIE